MARQSISRPGGGSGALHDDSQLMVPPPGFKFIPKSENVCGKSGCFDCFDIYCERCESKDRRIVELEMRNNDLVKYVTQLQGRFFGTRISGGGMGDVGLPSGVPPASMAFPHPASSSHFAHPALAHAFPQSAGGGMGGAYVGSGGGGVTEPFAYVQSPVLYDPSMNVSYIATTSFSPANSNAPAAGGKSHGGASADSHLSSASSRYQSSGASTVNPSPRFGPKWK